MIKRVAYESVRIATIGGSIEIRPSTDGWAATFTPSKEPRISYGADAERAGEQLVKDLKYTANAVEEDIKAFVERNK